MLKFVLILLVYFFPVPQADTAATEVKYGCEAECPLDDDHQEEGLTDAEALEFVTDPATRDLPLPSFHKCE